VVACALLAASVTVASVGIVAVTPASRADAGPIAPIMPIASPFPMTMPVTGMVESLVGGGCPSGRSHPGIDISNPAGTATEIHAAYPGTAYLVNRGDGYGIRVEIVHPYPGGYYLTRYAHLSQAFVPPEGRTVEQGDVIGMMGGTGNAQIVHLHFEIRQGTTPGSDVAVDVNSAFRPCRNQVVAGWPIPIDFPPLIWVPRHDAFVALDIALLGVAPPISADETSTDRVFDAVAGGDEASGRGREVPVRVH
jgi:murein DD-endopeptidase MepM/ murein hydrolase activator NlpD